MAVWFLQDDFLKIKIFSNVNGQSPVLIRKLPLNLNATIAQPLESFKNTITSKSQYAILFSVISTMANVSVGDGCEYIL